MAKMGMAQPNNLANVEQWEGSLCKQSAKMEATSEVDSIVQGQTNVTVIVKMTVAF